MQRRHHAISLEQASQESPTLAKLVALTRDSSANLQAIVPLLPPGLRPHVQAGPLDYEQGYWCVLVRGNAAAAKLRHLLPTLEAHLHSTGRPIWRIRLKIHS